MTDRQTDGRTDRRTEISSQYRGCITCSAVIKPRRFGLSLHAGECTYVDAPDWVPSVTVFRRAFRHRSIVDVAVYYAYCKREGGPHIVTILWRQLYVYWWFFRPFTVFASFCHIVPLLISCRVCPWAWLCTTDQRSTRLPVYQLVMLQLEGISQTSTQKLEKKLKLITTLWSIDQLAQEITVNHNEHSSVHEMKYNKHRKIHSNIHKAKANSPQSRYKLIYIEA